MARPSKTRRVCKDPGFFNIKSDRKGASREVLTMTVDEYESVRLIDYEGVSQEECAVRMDIARTTAQAIYNSARTKLAKCLIEGANLHVEGGNIQECDGTAGCPHCKNSV